MASWFSFFSILFVFTFSLAPQTINVQPEELGQVSWLRSMETAQKQSLQEGKPILILFQEVPGCATCRRYGNDILSHPLIVEAIESEFVPLAIFNNKGGEDKKVLEYFNEPSWKNPVVRFVNAQKADVVSRLSGNYSPHGLVTSMLWALNASGRVSPRYLQLLGEEFEAEQFGTEQATLAMYCFWTGEKELGKVNGVVATEAGFMGGREVVQVKYNPNVLAFDDLVKKADQVQCADHVFTETNTQENLASRIIGKNSTSPMSNYRPDKEPKYFLSKTPWKYVPMTELQALKANSLIGQRKSPEEVFSPRQLALVDFIQKHKNLAFQNLIGVELTKAWGIVESIQSGK